MNIFGKYLIGIWYEYQNVQWQAILGLTSTFGFMIQPHISSLLNSIKYPFLVSRRQREPRGRQMLGLAAQYSQELSRINVSNFHGKCRLFLPSLSISIGIMAATCCPCRRGGVPDEAEKIEIWHKSQPHWAINRGMGTLWTYSYETSTYMFQGLILIEQMKNSPKVLHHVSSWWQESSETYKLLRSQLENIQGL